ncbi:MAG: DUF2400 family protein, partial [Myxococcales bacterium]|nr:DUF2400 family protein [Myxococcales bacterium]
MPVGAPSLEKHLNALVDGSDAVARRAADPVSFVHRYRGRGDREVVGLVAASLAFGNVAAVRASIAKVLAVLGNAPARAIATRSERELAEALDGFVHRVYRGRDVARLLANAAAVRREHGSLGAAFEAHLAQAGEFREALARFADALRG